jgi:hypothetical protein
MNSPRKRIQQPCHIPYKKPSTRIGVVDIVLITSLASAAVGSLIETVVPGSVNPHVEQVIEEAKDLLDY